MIQCQPTMKNRGIWSTMNEITIGIVVWTEITIGMMTGATMETMGVMAWTGMTPGVNLFNLVVTNLTDVVQFYDLPAKNR